MIRLVALFCVVGYSLGWSPRLMLPRPRIVGGSDATPGAVPSQLLLERNGNFGCGAVLITPTRALTAAHCLKHFPADSVFSIVAGKHRLSEDSDNEERRPITSWTAHPDYSTEDGYPNDIAILGWDEPLPTNTYIEPIQMVPSSAADVSGATCTVSGWGMTESGKGELADVLQQVDMTALSTSECARRFDGKEGAAIHDSHLCVQEENATSCNGDSGGPVVCGGLLAGITSWGVNPCNGAYPTVNARVGYYQQWINENL